MTASELVEIKKRISDERDSVWSWAYRWSFVHHTFIYGAAILSGFAAIIIEMNLTVCEIESKDIGALLAALAALMTTIAGIGGFQRKWRTCRHTNMILSDLEVDAMSPDANPSEIIERYKGVWREHEIGIVGPD